ncbi:MAG: type IV pilin protein [Legionellales bacterium]|nr:type IV pilin protein [Legionellales bacterium]
MKRNQGFTLIELMITVAIVGVIVAIAVPMYNQHIMATRRVEATMSLNDLAARMERFHTMNNTYATIATPASLGATNPANYTLSIPTQTANTFTIRATPVAGTTQANDPCGSFTLTQAGVIGVTGTENVNTCWRR